MKIERKKNVEFGVLAALVLVVVSVWTGAGLTAAIIAVLAVTLLAPVLFTPLAWLWFRIGAILGEVVTRVIMFVLFFAVVTPLGVVRKSMGGNPLRLRDFKKGDDSVFTVRNKRYEPRDLERQF